MSIRGERITEKIEHTINLDYGFTPTNKTVILSVSKRPHGIFRYGIHYSVHLSGKNHHLNLIPFDTNEYFFSPNDALKIAKEIKNCCIYHGIEAILNSQTTK